jgi:hypothetical protein
VCNSLRRWVTPFIGLFALLSAGCAAGGAEAVGTAEKAQSPDAAEHAQQWTREKVTTLFLDPAAAGLEEGKSQTIPQGTTAKIDVCVPFDPMNVPAVPVDQNYSTAAHDTDLEGKGRLVQQAWVLPSDDEAAALSKQIADKVVDCRYSGATHVMPDHDARIDGSSTTYPYPRDRYGWRGQRVEQTTAVERERSSVSTQLLLQRGPVILRLHYTNYGKKAPAPKLRDYNMSVLSKALAHPA